MIGPILVVAYAIAACIALWEAITNPCGDGSPMLSENEIERRRRG